MRSVRSRVAILVALLLVLATFPLVSASADAGGPYYISMGDSVAAGWQPDEFGDGQFTNQGYPDQLYRRLRDDIPGLQHIKLGCPGETTATLNTGGICPYANGSQLNEAVAFLLAHPGEVEFITINIGANDVLPCLAVPPQDQPACLGAAFGQVAVNLRTALGTLRAVGADDIVGMNYYNPNLAYWLHSIPPSGDAGRGLAQQTNELTASFNDVILEPAYADFLVPVADVHRAFRTDRWHLVRKGTPFNVFRICQFTWMCADPPVGPDIHPNRRGHGVIAHTFQIVLNHEGMY